jgi:hypothetical protein
MKAILNNSDKLKLKLSFGMISSVIHLPSYLFVSIIIFLKIYDENCLLVKRLHSLFLGETDLELLVDFPIPLPVRY